MLQGSDKALHVYIITSSEDALWFADIWTIVPLLQDLGLPVAVRIRFQLNLAVRNTRQKAPVALFNNHTLPIFWLDWVSTLLIVDSLLSVLFKLLYYILRPHSK